MLVALTQVISLVVELPLLADKRGDLAVDGRAALEAGVGVEQEGGRRSRHRGRGRLAVVVGQLDPVPLGRKLLGCNSIDILFSNNLSLYLS